MDIYALQQDMQEAFALYLTECASIDSVDLSKIDELYKRTFSEDKSLYEIKDIHEYSDDIINRLHDKCQQLEQAEDSLLEDADIDDIERLIDLYREFLTAYKFFEAWSKPSEIRVEEEEIGKNTIIFGAPGTGKSYYIQKYIERITRIKDENKQPKIRTTFHPDSDYASFVGCYKPTKDKNKGDLTYSFVPQAFAKAYVEAWKEDKDKPYFLVIEEINRGNCAQIFGDLFQLLDRKDGVSEYPIEAEHDLSTWLSEQLSNCTREDMPIEIKEGKQLRLPSNLWILATMNTSDQSLYPMDSAFKRRWYWKYIPFERDKIEDYIVADGKAYSWGNFLEVVNAQIKEVTQSEDKQLGYRFVSIGESRQISPYTFINKVIFYLWNDVFKDFADSPFSKCSLTFHSFFRQGNRIDESQITKFLKEGLGVTWDESIDVHNITPRSAYSQVIRTKDTNAGGGKLRVTFPDGTMYTDNIAAQVLEDVIEKVGIEKVRELNIQVSGCPLIAANIEEVKPKYRQNVLKHPLSNGMLLFTTSSTPTKAEQLKRISTQTGIDFNVEVIKTEDEDTD